MCVWEGIRKLETARVSYTGIYMATAIERTKKSSPLIRIQSFSSRAVVKNENWLQTVGKPPPTPSVKGRRRPRTRTHWELLPLTGRPDRSEEETTSEPFQPAQPADASRQLARKTLGP